MAAPPVIVKLVEHFARNADSYRNTLNETEVRVQFVDPFFEALGWDVHNKQHYAETYKDVLHEYSLRTSAHTKAPDYCFQVGGARKFFVEAKRPAVHISADPAPAYQLRSYAWTSKLPLSLLTNFDEFAVYDCRVLPRPNDKSSVARIDLIMFDQYQDKWDDIVARFSREAVYQGSFDRYTESSKLKKGTAEVDDSFLAEIESWRKELAFNIALRNTFLTQRQVNFAVQRTIDRIIFLRICEDRGIEKYGQLQELQQNEHIYRHLCRIYERADEKYNSGLFHFTDEKNRAEAPDKLTPSLKIDDARLKPILKRLYYPESPYQFSHFPADILGHVYEQFLGQVIRLTSGHQAKIEPKPEVKKAGGVYYTPTYIVNYIIKNTIGKLLEGKNAKQASKLRILDPACGSGSFLLGAYQFLMNWHRDEYLKDGAEKHHKELYQTRGGDWRLTTIEKKRILLNNVYGVDIDSQAVEVTKLSLLLKVLEGENEQTIGTSLRLFHERALPDLCNNIKCGNSLIGENFYEGKQIGLLDEEDRYRINVFDWNGSDGFAAIMKSGFDAVIGNPPYGALFTDSEKSYLFTAFQAIKGQPESYEYFLFRALSLASKTGFVSFIVPTNFIESERAEGLRKALLKAGQVQILASFRYNVWRKNASETLVIVFKSGTSTGSTKVLHPRFPAELENATGVLTVRQTDWLKLPGARFLIRASAGLISKIEKGSVPLKNICEISQGIIVYKTRQQSARNLHISGRREGPEWKKLLDTKSSIQRYALSWGRRYLHYGEWLWCPRDPKYFERPKILFVRLRNKSLLRKLVGTYDEEKFYNRDNFNNIIQKDNGYSLKFVLGIFNSKLINYWYKAYFDNVNINPAQVSLIPIRAIVQGNVRHDRVVRLVDRMLLLDRQTAAAKTEHESTVLQRQIEATDREIDRLVYQLYGLTEQEVALIEKSSSEHKASLTPSGRSRLGAS